ncbi:MULTISPECIES: helix-turn-helix transcriptional regulator [Sorangium]|uniref:HTH cro/C1-type domain-containing protein n=1 Tax=Sorangium cellulosum TaxID=56 RepID=A0A4P2QKG4_SORCE|nr:MULTISPECIES: helix-turn-helix transcriptional regulator [Sorangium]AUX30484.1 uncharacterized protein SOCE836_025900 [Sorangium cellulosum]WCQ89878.1 hypothetical protein NQZ70_02576 [Sorangium sp. Soce836]
MARSAFGMYLQELREARGVSKAELARELKASWSTVNNWELHGALPEREKLRQVATVLKLKPEERTRLQALVEEGGGAPANANGTRGASPDAAPPPFIEGAAASSRSRSAEAQRMLEDVLTRALQPGRHTIGDAHSVLSALTEAAHLVAELEAPEEAARVWLDAAARLRARGVRVTGATLAVGSAVSQPADARRGAPPK